MKKAIELLNEMRDAGIINSYAVFGAVAQMRYTEAVVTLDLDILVDMPDADPLTMLSPIYSFCKAKGYQPDGEAIQIGDWPVQFLPTYDDLSKEALIHAEETDMDGARVRVLSADYLAVLALQTGRAKDKARIIALIEADAVDIQKIEEIVSRHQLAEQWDQFKSRFIDEG